MPLIKKMRSLKNSFPQYINSGLSTLSIGLEYVKKKLKLVVNTKIIIFISIYKGVLLADLSSLYPQLYIGANHHM